MSGVEIGALGILVSSMVWYLKYTTKHQAEREKVHDEERIKREDKRDEERKEEMLFIRNLVTNDMKELHQDSLKNADLNKQNLVLQKEGLGLQRDMLKSQTGLVKLIESVDKRINGRK